MYMAFRNADGDEMPIFDNEYFQIVDIDGITLADVSVSSASIADGDGDVINAQSINPRSVTFTIQVRQGVNPEACKRYVSNFVKPKQPGSLFLSYRDRDMVLSGIIQSVSMPRFSNAVAMQFVLYCSQPLWENELAITSVISGMIDLHRWEIVPKFNADIVMGELMEANTSDVINDGDVAIGMKIQIVALGTVVNPRIMREETEEYFRVNVTMGEKDELTICTVRGEKTVDLNGENIIELVDRDSIWLQLEPGRNRLVIDDDNGGVYMQVTLTARERYV